jgi:uncharacterized protein YmfQ (DUF2313 family)
VPVMQPTAAAYARMLKLLLPPGKAWRLDDDGVIARVLLANGDELARVSGRVADLFEEADPQTTSELLPEFERELDLTASGTDAERRARVVALLVNTGGVRPADFKRVLAGLLGQAEASVVVIERSRADAIAMADDREIYRFLIYRDPAAPGTYDLDFAQTMVDLMAHSHTKGHVIESIDFLCDDPFSLCDRDLLGV